MRTQVKRRVRNGLPTTLTPCDCLLSVGCWCCRERYGYCLRASWGAQRLALRSSTATSARFGGGLRRRSRIEGSGAVWDLVTPPQCRRHGGEYLVGTTSVLYRSAEALKSSTTCSVPLVSGVFGLERTAESAATTSGVGHLSVSLPPSPDWNLWISLRVMPRYTQRAIQWRR
eukprot:SAG25_NODE_812_length_5235_cov_10.472936_4_plen_172_part_00